MARLVGLFLGIGVFWLLLMVILLVVAWRKGRFIRSLKQLALGHLVLVFLALGCFWDFKASVTTPLMSTSDKVTIQQALRESSDEETYRVAFSGDELERGLRSAADILHVELNSEIEFPASDVFQLRFALKHPFGYLNGTLDGTARIEDGKLMTQLDRLWVGRLPFPGFIRGWINRIGNRVLESESVSKQAIESVVRGEIRDDQAHFEFLRRQNLTGSVATRLLPSETVEEIVAALDIVKAWAEARAASTRRSADDSHFVESTKYVFEQARSRHAQWSAIRQNRVAILAGGVIMGHTKLARLSGQPLAEDIHEKIAHASMRITVHNRNDLTRHFWVSAAIATFASARVSNMIGVTKEEMDSGEGGSGFSFADLLADRAGIRFAELALQTEASAKAIQTRVLGEWIATDAVAAIEGLPEGLSQKQFESQMGGVGGEGYRKWSEQINARIESSKLLLPIHP